MADFERLVPNFRGSDGREEYSMNSYRVTAFLGDFFDTLLYEKLQIQTSSRPIDVAYTDNQSFWRDALAGKHYQSMRINLQGFHLTEWMPLAPGRYFTPEADRSRKEASRFYRDGEFSPPGKEYMYIGGVGSVRLKAKTISSRNVYFLGASSTGISHQGIPVSLFEEEYYNLVQIIKAHGGCFANLTGTLQVLPTEMALIEYDREVPKYCLFLDKVEIIRPSTKEELLFSIAVLFPFSKRLYPDLNSFERSWVFCSFRPGSSGPDILKESLDKAVVWLKEYVRYHFNQYATSIVYDFDEHYQHFKVYSPLDVEFPIAQFLDGSIDPVLLREYQRHYRFIINTQVLNLFDNRKGAFMHHGDQINMTGNFQNVNVKSQLIQATQSINALPNVDQKTKDDLTQLVRQLSGLLQQVPSDKAADAEKISKRVEALMKEAQKPDPDKEEVEFNLNSFKSAAANIAHVLPAILPIASQIATFIGNIIH